MEPIQKKHFNILAAKDAYRRGQNVTEMLKAQLGLAENNAAIIETAYDLQAGTYVKLVELNLEKAKLYAGEIAFHLNQHLEENCTLIDIGTGELTTISLVANSLKCKLKKLFAFDISWSRLFEGRSFCLNHMGDSIHSLVPFVAEIGEIPLPDKSVDFLTSSHALEPNGGSLVQLLKELFRVTSKKIILFEPCYEICDSEGKLRMDKLGYIKGMDQAVESLGGKIVQKTALKNIANPLNPTVCFVIVPPESKTEKHLKQETLTPTFSVPGTSIELTKINGAYFSKTTGLYFPVIEGIPILRSQCAVLTSSLEIDNRF